MTRRLQLERLPGFPHVCKSDSTGLRRGVGPLYGAGVAACSSLAFAVGDPRRAALACSFRARGGGLPWEVIKFDTDIGMGSPIETS